VSDTHLGRVARRCRPAPRDSTRTLRCMRCVCGRASCGSVGGRPPWPLTQTDEELSAGFGQQDGRGGWRLPAGCVCLCWVQCQGRRGGLQVNIACACRVRAPVAHTPTVDAAEGSSRAPSPTAPSAPASRQRVRTEGSPNVNHAITLVHSTRRAPTAPQLPDTPHLGPVTHSASAMPPSHAPPCRERACGAQLQGARGVRVARSTIH